MIFVAAPDPLDLLLDRFAPQLQLKQEAGKRFIRCFIRKTWLVLQPEEFVRQLLLLFLVEDMHYNRNRITVERGLEVEDQAKRTDILVFDRQMRPFLLIECKAPKVKLTDQTFRQLSTYNGPLAVPYLMISNGRASYVCEMDYDQQAYHFLVAPPEYPSR